MSYLGNRLDDDIDDLKDENNRLLEIEADARIRLDDRQERIESLTADNKRLWDALERLDTCLVCCDGNHSPYYTFNEDDAKAIRAALHPGEER